MLFEIAYCFDWVPGERETHGPIAPVASIHLRGVSEKLFKPPFVLKVSNSRPLNDGLIGVSAISGVDLFDAPFEWGECR